MRCTPNGPEAPGRRAVTDAVRDRRKPWSRAVPVVSNSVIKANKLGYKPYSPATMGIVIYIMATLGLSYVALFCYEWGYIYQTG